MQNLKCAALGDSFEQLVLVYEGEIGGQRCYVVNARELHTFLGVQQKFASWIKERINQYGLQKGRDFKWFTAPAESNESYGGRPRIEYLLTVTAALDVAGHEKTEQGRRLRRYLFDVAAAAPKIDSNARFEEEFTMQELKPVVVGSHVAQLVQVYEGEIGGQRCYVVNARDLYTVLEVVTAFHDWIKYRIEHYGFLEGRDFERFTETSVKPNPQGGRPRIEYLVTLDMAKELAMVERTEQGRRVRRYFIEVEKAFYQVTGQAEPILSPVQLQELQDLADMKVSLLPLEARGMAKAELWARVHRKFGVNKYEKLPVTRFDEVKRYIREMRLSAGDQSEFVATVNEYFEKTIAFHFNNAMQELSRDTANVLADEARYILQYSMDKIAVRALRRVLDDGYVVDEEPIDLGKFIRVTNDDGPKH